MSVGVESRPCSRERSCLFGTFRQLPAFVSVASSPSSTTCTTSCLRSPPGASTLSWRVSTAHVYFSKFILQTAGFDGKSFIAHLQPMASFLFSPFPQHQPDEALVRLSFQLKRVCLNVWRIASKTTPTTSSALPPRARTSHPANSSSVHTTRCAPVRYPTKPLVCYMSSNVFLCRRMGK